jgi:hypothetical protein
VILDSGVAEVYGKPSAKYILQMIMEACYLAVINNMSYEQARIDAKTHCQLAKQWTNHGILLSREQDKSLYIPLLAQKIKPISNHPTRVHHN